MDGDGQLVIARRGRGANAFAAGAASTVSELLLGSMADLPPGMAHDVDGIVVGLAGLLARPEAAASVRKVFAGLSYGCEPLVVNDAEAMFASGTAGEDGHVLVGGTGAIAMGIQQTRAVAVVDGHGWLLGDEGSGVWIGLEGLRAALRALDGRGQQTSLASEVPRMIESISGQPCALEPTAIVRAANELPRSALGLIARTVDREAMNGDAVSHSILVHAAASLIRTLEAAVEQSGVEGPIVLGGSVIHDSATIRDGLVGMSHARWPSTAVRVVKDGAAGAALWARRQAGIDYDDARLEQLRQQIETSVLDLSTRN